MPKLYVIILVLGFTLAGCDKGPMSPRGFSLPVGDIEKGEQVFKEFKCLACHALEGYERDNIEKELNTTIKLGGKTHTVMTYAELVTSIINPSHKISIKYNPALVQEGGVSKMRNYNDVMTVTQLIDLVSFLQPQYKLVPYEPYRYRRYP